MAPSSSARALPALLLLACGARGGSPSPSCMLNGEPCPMPSWAPDWSLRNSTAMMAHSNIWTGPVQPVHHWGLLSIDWGCNRGGDPGPANHGWNRLGPAHATCEATSAANCVALKEAGLVTRCGIYHNLELSLQWLESQRAVMDEAHVAAGWFLRFPGNGSVFAHDIPPGDQWFIDWRSPQATQYFVHSMVDATMQAGVDVTFSDDRSGVPNEHPEVQPALGMSNESLAELQFATQEAGQYLATVLAQNNRTCWDCLGGTRGQQAPPRDAAACAATMRAYCAPSMQGRGMFMGWSASTPNQTVAAFLIARPPIAFIGGRLDDHDWHPLFDLDVGEPLERALCQETSDGVFSRRWTKGTARLDCNTFTAELPFSSAASSDSEPSPQSADCPLPPGTPREREEFFIFATDTSAYLSWNWTAITTIALYGGAVPGLLCHAHANGARVVYGAGLTAEQLLNHSFRASWVAAQASQIETGGYDGINLDVRNTGPAVSARSYA